MSVAPHNPEREDIKIGLRETFDRATAVHCVSEATRKDACQLGLDPAKARVIRPAVDPQVFRPSHSRPDSNSVFRLVTTGTLIWGLVDGERSVAGIAAELRARVADPPAELEADVVRFLATLRERDLVV